MVEDMGMYKRMYLRVAGVLADAVEALEEKRYETARRILVKAAQDAEDIFMWEEEQARDNGE